MKVKKYKKTSRTTSNVGYQTNVVLDQRRIMLHCSKFSLLSNDLFSNLNIDYHHLNPSVAQSVKISNRLMNPLNVEE